MKYPSRLKAVLAFLIFVGFGLAAKSDKVKVNGEERYFAPANVTDAAARRIAVEKARNEAIRLAFGTFTGEQNTIVSNEGKSRGFSETTSEVMGVWIEDIGDPFADVSIKSTPDGTVYTAKVEGYARPLERAPIDLDIRLLVNGTDKNRNRLHGDTYYEGDEFYVYFKSPVAGNLVIYLGDDDEDLTMQCMLPYDGQKEGAYHVEADTEYVFFSKQTAEPQMIDFATRMIMYCRKPVDTNTVNIIFSPNEISKANTSANRTAEVRYEGINLMPRETKYKDYNKWLGKLRNHDLSAQIYSELIFIKK